MRRSPLPVKERKSLAAALNTLLASPTFASWRQGTSLDMGEWLTPKDGRREDRPNAVAFPHPAMQSLRWPHIARLI